MLKLTGLCFKPSRLKLRQLALRGSLEPSGRSAVRLASPPPPPLQGAYFDRKDGVQPRRPVFKEGKLADRILDCGLAA